MDILNWIMDIDNLSWIMDIMGIYIIQYPQLN